MSSQHADVVMRDILGDNSAPVNEDAKNSLERLNHFITIIIIDLRKNNGKWPKFDEFWEVVALFIEEQTAANHQRHNNSYGEGELVLNFTTANSYADMYRRCIEISKNSKQDIGIPSYAWFLLQFWPTTKTSSNILHYTGQFKVDGAIKNPPKT